MIKKTDAGTWSVRVGGGESRTFTRKKDAEEYESKVKTEKRRAKVGLMADRGPITYDALADLYLDTLEKPAWTSSILKHSRKKFGKRLVRTLTSDEIAVWVKGLDQAPSTVTHILTVFRTVLALGVEWRYLESSPAASRFIRGPGRDRVDPIQPFESWDEVLAVAARAGRYGSLIRFVCSTGLRPSEWRELRWKDIDFKTKSCHVRGTKTRGSDRVIPLSVNALAALGEVERNLNAHAHVFKTRQGNAIALRWWRDTYWKSTLEAAGVNPRPPYQMRHTFATLALEKGLPIDAVSKLMGHESIETTLRYYAKWTRPMVDNARSILDTIGETECTNQATS